MEKAINVKTAHKTFKFRFTFKLVEQSTLVRLHGDLNYLGKGLGVQMIKEFLLSQFANKREVFIDPEATNTRAIHVYEKVGFYKVGEFIAKWHPVPHIQLKLDMNKLLN